MCVLAVSGSHPSLLPGSAAGLGVTPRHNIRPIREALPVGGSIDTDSYLLKHLLPVPQQTSLIGWD